MTAPANTFWTEDKVAELKRLHATGMSNSAMAVELGCPSRNAVIGKAARLGLDPRTTRSKPSGKPRAPRVPRSFGYRQPASAIGVLTDNVPDTDLEAPEQKPKTLLQLTSTSCRWPIGDPASTDFFFCGADTDKTYCAYHHRLGHT